MQDNAASSSASSTTQVLWVDTDTNIVRQFETNTSESWLDYNFSVMSFFI
jgi:hypothetical protein